ncbi:STAS domain-containing protein [Kitasatospora sp. NPDC059571]|uniref:STAS domain-containing protein n=1 Tax=Kitasatospora sp. NPDC059571 TaxID=3346871 RepID=UPI0036B814FD
MTSDDRFAGRDREFTVEDRDTPVGPVLTVLGELDLGTGSVLRAAARRALARTAPGPAVLRLDLTGVSFCDSSGLNALLTVRAEGEAVGTLVAVTGTSPTVARLLQITGTAAMLLLPA